MLNRFSIKKPLNIKIFLVYLFTFIVFNILAFLNIEKYNISVIYSSVFLLTIPGMLILSLFRMNKLDYWEVFLLSLGLSASYLMIGGLIMNWVLLYFGVNNPLTFTPLMLFINVTLAPLVVFRLKSTTRIEFNKLYKKLVIKNILLIAPYSLLFFVVTGSILFINDVHNYNTLIGLFIGAILVAFLTIRGNRVNKNILLTTASALSLYVLYMISLRGRTFFGSDIIGENLVLELTKQAGYWADSNQPGSLYNLCLSITVLPTIISTLSGANNLIIFKNIFPIIYSFIPVGIFIISNKYFNRTISFVAAVFFLSSPSFWSIMPTHQREGIGLFFFTLVLIIFLSKKYTIKSRYVYLTIFGLSTILSHYSTAFIMLLWLSIIYLIAKLNFILVFINKKVFKNRFKLINKINFDIKLSLILLIFLWIAFIAWYTRTPKNNFNIYITKIINNLKYSFNNEIDNLSVKADRSSITDQLNILYKANPERILNNKFEELKYSAIKGYKLYPESTYKDYKIQYIPPEMTDSIFSVNIRNIIYYSGEFIKRLGLFFIFAGFIALLINSAYREKVSKAFYVTSLIFASFIALSMVIPYVSLDYNIGRVYIQSLIPLSILASVGLCYLSNFLRKLKKITAAIFISLHVLIFTGALYYIVGIGSPPIQFSNTGEMYETLYINDSEIYSANWLKSMAKNELIYADPFTRNVLKVDAQSANLLYYTLLIPSLIPIQAYIYLGTTNTTNNMAYTWINSITIGYNIPIHFLKNNKNLIYNSGESKIYK